MAGALPLTVLCGFDRPAVADIGAGLLLTGERLALIWVDPSTADQGHVQSRVTDSDGRCTEQSVAIEHGCLSCAMCEAVGTAVRALASTGRYDTVLIHLHPGVEADAAIEAMSTELAGTAAVDTVVLHLHSGWLNDLSGDAIMQSHGVAVAPDDDRSVAAVLAADLTAATVVVVPGGPATGMSAEEHATLAVLTPGATRLHPASSLDIDPELIVRTGSFRGEQLDVFTPRGLLDPHPVLPEDGGTLRLVRWTSPRPLHPQRLHDRLDHLGDGVIRSLGHLWLATRPHRVVRWDSAGNCLFLGRAGLWTTRLPGAPAHPIQTRPSSAQRRHARSHRHPVYGDRRSLLGFLGNDLDPEGICRVLDSCLLTDAELAAGPTRWSALRDPFPDWADEHPTTNTGRGAA